MKKRIPKGATGHINAGPYSPVLEIECSKLVVLSGQAAINMDGTIQGETIEEQAAGTLENCLTQLISAGCTMEDVFKVNVYMADLVMWEAFNSVYERYIPEPRPVRTAVQTGLLPGLLVEVEMWAVK